MIELQDVSKNFGSKKAVDHISAVIPDGAITAFIGPNGAGKTTTIHMITGVLQPDSGTIQLNGSNIVSQPLEAKKKFALVPDSPDVFLRLTGLEYINFMADLYNVDGEKRKERILSLSKEFGMENDLNQRMITYSHGMRQKTIIIAALVCDPPIWILDEPMTGLDPSSSYLLKQKMKEHAAKGNAVFFSTHVLEVAEKLCDKILFIVQGKIAFDGTLEELKAKYPEDSLEQIFMEVAGHA